MYRTKEYQQGLNFAAARGLDEVWAWCQHASPMTLMSWYSTVQSCNEIFKKAESASKGRQELELDSRIYGQKHP